MADVEKKINLRIESNFESLVKMSSKLTNNINELQKQVKIAKKDLNQFSVDNLYKSLKNAKQALKDVKKEMKEINNLQKEYDKINKDKTDYKALENTIKIRSTFIKNMASLNLVEGFGQLFKSGFENKFANRAEAENAKLDLGIKNRQGRIATHQDEIRALKKSIAIGEKAEPTEANQAKLKADKAALKKAEGQVRRLENSNNAAEAQKIQNTNKASISTLKATIAINAAVSTLKFFGNVIKDTTGVTLSLKENFNAVIGEIGKIMNMREGAATYATGSSLITNAAAREQQLKYGLSDAQNYAFTQAKEALNIKSDEDIMYMNAKQREKFSVFMDKYSKWYDKMESSGVLEKVQEMQLDLYMFKQELAMDFMNWFAENKDSLLTTIKTISKLVMSLVSAVLKIIEFVSNPVGAVGNLIGNIFGGNKNISSSMSTTSGYSDIGSSYNTSNKTNNVNITMTNNATGVLSNQNALQDFFKEEISKASKQLVSELG